MKMSENTHYCIDNRNLNDVHKEISRLAASFAPEWQYNIENPDIGTVIGITFANQLAGNIGKFNRVFEKYHTEFVNLLNISLQPAYPASGVVVVEIMQDATAGIDMPKATRLFSGANEGGEPIIFETATDLHVTSSVLKDIFTVSSLAGKMLVLRGDIKPEYNVAAGDDIEHELAMKSAEEHVASGEQVQTKPVMSLFDFSVRGIQQNMLLLYHKTVFNTCGGVDILIRFSSDETDEKKCRELANPQKYRWLYKGPQQFLPFAKVSAEKGRIRLAKTEEMSKVLLQGQEYLCVCVQAIEPVTELFEVEEIAIASECEGSLPQFVCVNGQDVDVENFLPFGDRVSLFDECYVCHNDVFAQQGAVVRLSFELHTQQKLATMTPEQEEAQLKVIKRRPQNIEFVLVDTSPQQVAFEYYNGEGWRRLPLDENYSTIFDGTHSAQIDISFVCPADWQPMAVGFDGRSIRIRVTQADNCYLQPCRHTMPIIKEMRIAYSYCSSWQSPQLVQQVSGIKTQNFAPFAMQNKRLAIFKPLPYGEEACYFGFDKKMESGPISLLFEMEKAIRAHNVSLKFEYYGPNGFAPLSNVVDYTENLAHSGMLVFMPPQDFIACEIEGRRRWWLRIVDEKRPYEVAQKKHVNVNDIRLNAVAVHNAISMAEEFFYVDAAIPNMAFALAAPNVLRADVFVNELGRFSAGEMQKMAKEKPNDVRIEYGFTGEVAEFFVRWQEVDNFDCSKGGARHYVIDKSTSILHFGDGLSSALPMAGNGVALTVQCVCCNGARANLPAGAVNTLAHNILHIENVQNPMPTSAGSNMESVDRAHQRGTNIISSRNKLVSVEDFVREVLSFSSAIDKVECVIGTNPTGEKLGRLVTIAVLMREFKQGEQSFAGMARRLKEKLLPRCELTLGHKNLLVCEPVFVVITIDVWMRAGVKAVSFAVRNLIIAEIEKFINPVSGNQGAGWKIGELPTEKQILQKLHSIQCDAQTDKFLITVSYTDENGAHECELAKFPQNPFVVGINGKHKVHYNLN